MANDYDRLKQSLVTLIRRTLGASIIQKIDYLAAYQCKVITQNTDGTLELQPDDARLPPYQKVSIRYGVPGVSALIANGARVLLEFAGGDPQKPIATVWESASVTKLVATASAIDLGGGATEALVKGTSYATHMGNLSTALTALSNSLTPLMLPPAVAAAKAALQLAITAVNALAADVSAQNKTL
jgi:hypothetical protein